MPNLGFLNPGTTSLSRPRGQRPGRWVSRPACWQRQFMDLVTDSSEEMNEAIVHLV